MLTNANVKCYCSITKNKEAGVAAQHVINRNGVSVNWMHVICAFSVDRLYWENLVLYNLDLFSISLEWVVVLKTCSCRYWGCCLTISAPWFMLERSPLPLQATWSLRFFHLIGCCLCGKIYSDGQKEKVQKRKKYGSLERSTFVAPTACWWNLRRGEMRPVGRRDDEMSVTVLLSSGCVLGPLFTRTAVTLPAINGHSHDQRDLICPLERKRKGM